jgi:hypothetical protein
MTEEDMKIRLQQIITSCNVAVSESDSLIQDYVSIMSKVFKYLETVSPSVAT